MTVERTRSTRNSRSLGELIGQVPTLIIELVKAELASLKHELTGKAKDAGLGIGLLVGAVVLLFFFACTLIASIILVIAIWLPAWASALIVTGVLLILIAILALVGVSKLKKGIPPLPTDAIDSIKKDVQAFKGVGTYDR